MHVWDVSTWAPSIWSQRAEFIEEYSSLPQPLVTRVISIPGLRSVELSTYRSPLDPQSYTMWVEARAIFSHTVEKYHLTPTHKVSLDCVSSRQIQNHNNRSSFLQQGISFAGHTRLQVRIGGEPVTPKPHSIISCSQPSVVPLDAIPLVLNSSHSIHMSPYSGALTVSGYGGGVFIYYYE